MKLLFGLLVGMSLLQAGAQEIDTSQKRIVFFAPFHTDLLLDSATFARPSIPTESVSAISFYEGMLTAFDSLEHMGANFRISVFDTRDDTNRMKALLLVCNPDSTDLIIGPFYNSEIKFAEEFSRVHEVPLVAPYASLPPAKSNSNFMMCSPSLRQQMDAMVLNAFNTSQPARIFILQPNRPQEKMYAQLLKESIEQTNHVLPFKPEIIILSDSSTPNCRNPLAAFSAVQENVVFIPTTDEEYLNQVLQLMNPVSDSLNILIYGLPVWKTFETTRMDYLEALHAKIPVNFYADKTTAAYKSFQSRYFKKFKAKPNEYAVQGYDLMMYFGYVLLHEGSGFTLKIDQYDMWALGGTFRFRALIQDSRLLCYQNNFVQLLQYTGNTLMPVK